MAMGNNPIMMIDPDGGWYLDAGFSAQDLAQNVFSLAIAGAAGGYQAWKNRGNPSKGAGKTGIKTFFFDENGKALSSIPNMVQDMFNQEYGIKVGYKKGVLYKEGDISTDNKVSPKALEELNRLFGKSPEFAHSLVFGHHIELKEGKNITDVTGGVNYLYEGGTNVTVINLAHFNSDGSFLGATYGSIPVRTFNLARVFEHEYIGHNISGYKDKPKEGETDINLINIGPNDVNIGNVYRKDMRLPERTKYDVGKGDIKHMWFGESSIEMNMNDLPPSKFRLKVVNSSLNISLTNK